MHVSVLRLVSISFAVLAAMDVSPVLEAQQSNGLTFYHLADSNTKDSSGNVLTGIKLGQQTDGKSVVFESGTATTACDSAALLYSMPIAGGTLSTLMGPSLLVETAQPSGTTTTLCNHLVLSGSTLLYPANYTPAGGTLRSGIFKLPIAGGASADVIATGDSVTNIPQIAQSVQAAPGESINIVPPGTVTAVYTTTFSADPSANLIADYGASFSAAGAGSTKFAYELNTYLVYGKPQVIGGEVASSSCNKATIPLPVLNYVATDGTVFANLANGTGVNSQGTTGSAQFLNVGPWPYGGNCGEGLFDPDWGSFLGSTATYLLPQEPLPNTQTPVSTMSMQSVAVSNGVTYLSAIQNLSATQGSYSGIFTAADNLSNPIGLPINGIYPANNPPIISKIVSNYDAVPGITLGVATCPGGVSQMPVMGSSFAVAGNYLVFVEAQQLQDCNTMAITRAGGFYAYNLNTQAIQQIAPYGAVLVAGDPALSSVTSPQPGALAADGHFTFVMSTTDANTSITTSTLYSTYLPQIVTAVALASPASSTYGGGVTLTAKVSPNTGAANSATGSVQFVDGTTVLGSQVIDSTGTATLSLSSLAPGSHTIKALYAGDSLYEGASSAVATLAVTKLTPSLMLTASASTIGVGQSVTLTAQASSTNGTPTGQITFASATGTLGTAMLGNTGVATLALTTLPLGTTQITATYGGDLNFAGATSSVVSVGVGTPDYTVTANPTSQSITAGQTATFVFTVTPLFGFNQPVAFACSGLPANATCQLNPATVTPAGAAATSTLTITTNVKTASAEKSSFPLGGSGLPTILAAGLLGLPLLTLRRRRATWMGSLFLLLAFAGLATAIGCSGGGSPAPTTPATPKGTSTVSVSASTGSGATGVNHSVSVTLTIN